MSRRCFLALLLASNLTAGGALAADPFMFPEGTEFDQVLVVDSAGNVVTNQVSVIEPGDGMLATSSIAASSVEASSVEAMGVETSPSQKVAPSLASLPAGGSSEVVIAFRRDSRLPPLPKLLRSEPREGSSNVQRLAERKSRLDDARNVRLGALAAAFQQISKGGGAVLEYYVIGNSVKAVVPNSLITQLAQRDDVVAIGPAEVEVAAPASTIAAARARINTDYYWNYGYTGLGAGFYVGVLDTGVMATHSLLASSQHLAFQRDCVNGGTYCEDTGSASFDPGDCENHGTGTISIITGDSDLGAASRGVTEAGVDSFKVYTCNGLSIPATLKGFNAAVVAGDDVVLVEVDAPDTESSSLALAADDAYDAGSIVIVPNGNSGPGAATVGCPANAHKALGIGAYDTSTLELLYEQSRGPTADGRIKPDLMMPTGVYAASTTCSTCLGAFWGTSSSAAFGAGAAMLIFDQYSSMGWGTNPGLIYAAMLGWGEYASSYNNTYGVGKVVLPSTLTGQRWRSGSKSVGSGQSIDIQFTTTGDKDLRAAIWWPEEYNYSHNDIDLRIINPSGQVVATSSGTGSVFEFAKVDGNLVNGTWTVRLAGYSVPISPQTVYYMVAYKMQ